jgi:hypothetical protein
VGVLSDDDLSMCAQRERINEERRHRFLIQEEERYRLHSELKRYGCCG